MLKEAYTEAMEKFESSYEKVKAMFMMDIENELRNRSETVAVITELSSDEEATTKMINEIITSSEERINLIREKMEETIERMRKSDSALTASMLGIPDPLANS